MYRVNVERNFDAAHYLRGYRGRCENLHGHRYRVAACLRAENTDETGLAYDFSRFKQVLDGVISCFDHACLNEVPPFDVINPSSENIARVIYDGLNKSFTDLPAGLDLESVTVWESPGSWVEYRPG